MISAILGTLAFLAFAVSIVAFTVARDPLAHRSTAAALKRMPREERERMQADPEEYRRTERRSAILGGLVALAISIVLGALAIAL